MNDCIIPQVIGLSIGNVIYATREVILLSIVVASGLKQKVRFPPEAGPSFGGRGPFPPLRGEARPTKLGGEFVQSIRRDPNNYFLIQRDERL